MKPSASILAIAFLINSGLLHAAPCVGTKSLQQAAPSGAISNIVDAIRREHKEHADCGSLNSVLDKIANRKRTGGRKLEQDKPLDVTAAQANLDKALRDPGVRRRVNQLRSEVQDPNLRMVYEAAIFDEEGYYGARELRIQQLQQTLK